MIKNFKTKLLSLIIMQFLVFAVAFTFYGTIAYYQSTIDDNGQGNYPGAVGLRSYFQEGTGSSDKPFVISRPIHFYNLTRLQNLGVFNQKFYFSLGYDPTGGNNLQFYENDSSNNLISYLDMSSYASVMSIGNEGTPFYGNFNGNGMVICNLKVISAPEDVGVFGYTYSGSSVSNVYFKDLLITDNGYDKGVNNLDNLYNTIDYGTLDYKIGTNLNRLVATKTEFHDTTGSFIPTMPSINNIKFELRSSSEYVSTVKLNNEWKAVINPYDLTDNKDSIYENSSFTATAGNRLNARLSIVGSVYDTNLGITYSKVFSTYLITFLNENNATIPSTVSFNASLDYVDSTKDYTQYTHNVNIGYLIGHCDGSCIKSFVYNGKLSLNNWSNNNFQSMPQETEIGLIGEIGPAINNEYIEKIENAQKGDTGVINFTKMYDDVIGTSTFTKNADNYYNYTPVSNNLFLEYLRNDNMTNKSYVTSKTDSFDFSGRQIIKDDETTDRGLGVFSFASDSRYSNNSSLTYQGIGNFNVAKSANIFNDYFYYTTAEFSDDPYTSNTNITNWNMNSSGDYGLINARSIPSYVDDQTWTPTFEKRFNYIFRVPFQSSYENNVNNPDFPNYFSNTKSAFLTRYFNYKLVDKTGFAPQVNNKNYGVFIKNVDRRSKITSNITEFDSYLTLNAPLREGKSTSYTNLTTNSDPIQIPANSINFSVKNQYGANVTILAASNSETGGYVSIYDKKKTLNEAFNIESKHPALHPSYTMFCPNLSSIDSLDYFEYSNTNFNVTGNYANHLENPSAYNATKLFCHTFKLPMGDYFISSPNGSADIYYICAQGQEDGNYGDQANQFSNLNIISEVDFLGRDPVSTGTYTYIYKTADRCKTVFKGTFSSDSGDLDVVSGQQITNGELVVDNPLTITYSSNLLSLYVWNENGYSITLKDSGGLTSTTFNDKYHAYEKGGV